MFGLRIYGQVGQERKLISVFQWPKDFDDGICPAALGVEMRFRDLVLVPCAAAFLASASPGRAGELEPRLQYLADTLAMTHAEIPSPALTKALLYMQEGQPRPTNLDFATIIDFTQPSWVERMFVIGILTGAVDSYLVAHGKNSGLEYATQFSNVPGSLMSSLGLYLTGYEYEGDHGRAIRLMGMEETNSNAEARDIVMHSAAYVSHEFIRSNGYLGRSWGCPVIEERFRDRLVDQLKDGSVLLIHGP